MEKTYRLKKQMFHPTLGVWFDEGATLSNSKSDREVFYFKDFKQAFTGVRQEVILRNPQLFEEVKPERIEVRATTIGRGSTVDYKLLTFSVYPARLITAQMEHDMMRKFEEFLNNWANEGKM